MTTAVLLDRELCRIESCHFQVVVPASLNVATLFSAVVVPLLPNDTLPPLVAAVTDQV